MCFILRLLKVSFLPFALVGQRAADVTGLDVSWPHSLDALPTLGEVAEEEDAASSFASCSTQGDGERPKRLDQIISEHSPACLMEAPVAVYWSFLLSSPQKVNEPAQLIRTNVTLVNEYVNTVSHLRRFALQRLEILVAND